MDAGQQTSGQQILIDTAIGTCATVSPSANSGKNVSTFSNKTGIIDYWSTGIDADKGGKGVNLNYAGFTLGVTSKVTLSSTFVDAKSIIASTLDQFTVSQVVDINRNSSNCWSSSNLVPGFVAAFESLAEIDASTVSEDSAWQPYREFLNNWGSHVQIKQEQGSRIALWESSTDTATVTTNDLEAKLCYDLGIPAAGSIGACSNYNTAQRTEASSKDIKKSISILGGDTASRTALVNRYSASNTLDADLMANFMAAGNTSSAPVKFSYIPLWSLLTQIYQPLCNTATKGQTACKNYQRALSLQAAYQGFMAYSCFKTSDSTGNPFQKMIALPPNSLGISAYACHASKSGCRRDKDCNYKDDGWWEWKIITGGYCEGSGCIQAQLIPETTNPPLYRAVQKLSDTSNDPHLGVNASCSNDTTPACNTDWEGGALERDLWNQAIDGPGEGNTSNNRLTPAVAHQTASSQILASVDSPDHFTLKLIVKREKPLNLKARRRELALSKARISANQEEYLTVSDSTGTLNCPGTCIGQFAASKQVNLKVKVPPNYTFLNWGGQLCDQRATNGHLCTFTMDGNKTIEVFFE